MGSPSFVGDGVGLAVTGRVGAAVEGGAVAIVVVVVVVVLVTVHTTSSEFLQEALETSNVMPSEQLYSMLARLPPLHQ